MKKIGVILFFFLSIVFLFSFEYPFLNLNEMIFLTPFSHYTSVEGFRENNSFYMDFNNISVINPIVGDIFIAPSLFLTDNINKKKALFSDFSIETVNNNNKAGFFRDGFSLKSEKTVNIINSLYYSFNKKSFNSAIILSNYGNSYTHFKDTFIGPGIETYISWENNDFSMNFYLNLKKNNNSVYTIDETEPSRAVKFEDNAKASYLKNFLGGSVKYSKKSGNSEYGILSSFSYGSLNQEGKNNTAAKFNSDNFLWEDNYPIYLKQNFLTINNKFNFTKSFKNINYTFELKINNINAKTDFHYSPEGIIYDESLKVSNYGYDFKINELNINPVFKLQIGSSRGISILTQIGYNIYNYSIENYSDKIVLNSIDYLIRLNYQTKITNFHINYSSYSKPLNLIKFMYLSNNFDPYIIEEFNNESGEKSVITPFAYIFDHSKKFNRINRIKTGIKIENSEITIKLSAVYKFVKYFWDRSISEKYNDLIIGELDNLKQKYLGFNLSVGKSFYNGFIYGGITYMKTKGNYNNDFNSILSNYSLSKLYLDENFKKTVNEDYSLTYGNGLKFYLYSKYDITNNIKFNFYFVHMPPLNMINYKIGLSSFGVIPDSFENKTKSLNLLSVGVNYNKKHINIFLGIKNILSSTPVLLKNSENNQPLINYPSFGTIIGINYNF